MEKTIIAKVGNGRTLHIGTETTSKNGKKSFTVGCGAVRHHIGGSVRNTYLPVTEENVTCKKCKQRNVEMFKTQEKEQELNITAELKRMKESRESFYLAK